MGMSFYKNVFFATVAMMVACAALPAPPIPDFSIPKVDLVYEIADVAVSRMMTSDCFEKPGTPRSRCPDFSDLSAKDMRLYFGGLLPNNQTVMAVLPDGDAKLKGQEHHGFLVLDPFPANKLGHPVFMYFLDVNVTTTHCERFEGIYAELINNSTICLGIVNSQWCNERPSSLSWDCQIKFLPLVVPTKSQRQQADNLLKCWDMKDSFLTNCPDIRNDGTEQSDLCNHIKTNNGGCNLGSFKCTSQKLINQGVMMFGGWSRNVADFMTTYDLTTLRDRIMSWGFAQEDVRIFFSNGLGTKVEIDEDMEDDYVEEDNSIIKVEPADKHNIRKYIRNVCNSSQRCNVNTFFLYLSNPTMKGGVALFWDADGNGAADVDEMYSPKEFVHDISHCSARRVIVFIDQSYSGIWSSTAQNFSVNLPNVMIVPTTNVDGWTPRHSFAAYMRESNKHSCLSSYVKPFQESQVMPPVFTGFELERDVGNITITGQLCKNAPR